MSWNAIYRLVKRIPRGRVTTYGEIARALKVRGGARVVGYAMAGSPSGQGIPWHRVVGAGGKLIIREPHGEGVEISGMRINYKLYGWPPIRKGVRKRVQRQAKTRRRA
jgi:alkylated DNA nucleotide flippase Atl1